MKLSRERATAPARTISVTCLLFGRYAEIAGIECTELTLDAPATAADALAALRARVANATRLPAHPLLAVNREHAPPAAPLGDGDEVAILPPLAGG